MTAAQLKNYFRQQLVAQRQIAQEFNVLDALVDFISQAVTSGIPAWTAALTFNIDGTGDGSYTTHPDSNGALRFWKTKTDENINNEPPTNPATTENTHWIEVSPSDGSGIKEWAPGIFGEGLIIVYADLGSPDPDPGFYKLQVAERPFASTNLITELGAGDWIRIGSPAQELAASTGAEVAFDRPRRYGYPTAITGNITFSFTNAIEGMTQVMRHNDSTIPTLPASSKLLSGEYTISVNNYIYFVCILKGDTKEVHVTISQELV